MDDVISEEPELTDARRRNKIWGELDDEQGW